MLVRCYEWVDDDDAFMEYGRDFWLFIKVKFLEFYQSVWTRKFHLIICHFVCSGALLSGIVIPRSDHM